MPANAPGAHKRLGLIRRQLAKSRTSQVARITLGDSRNSYTRYRESSGWTRLADVPIRSVFLAPEDTVSAGMDRDGYGFFQLAAAITNVTTGSAAPGATLSAASSGTGIVNTLPVSLYQFMANTGTTNAHFSRVWTIYLTYAATGTNGMNSTNVATSTGGNARRGLPYGAVTPIQAVEVFRVTDNRATTAWAQFYLQAGQSVNNTDESNIGSSSTMAVPPAASSGLLITSETWSMPAFTLTSGNGISIRYRFQANPGIGQGGVVAGARVRFRDNGVTDYKIAQGGASTSDHLPSTVAGITNSDAKYTDDGIRLFLRSVANEPNLIIRIELGQNINSGGNALDEWDGTTNGRYKENIRDIMLRWMRILRETEFASRSVVFELLPPWYTATDQTRMRGQRDLLSQLADEMHTDAMPVALYDQVAELEALYTISGGTQGLDNSVGLMPANAGDPVHQNFDRVITLGTAEWDAIATTAEVIGTQPNLSPADSPAVVFNVSPSDSTDLTYTTTSVTPTGAGSVAVVMRDGQTVTFAAVPAGRRLRIRANRVLATGTTATGLVASA